MFLWCIWNISNASVTIWHIKYAFIWRIDSKCNAFWPVCLLFVVHPWTKWNRVQISLSDLICYLFQNVFHIERKSIYILQILYIYSKKYIYYVLKEITARTLREYATYTRSAIRHINALRVSFPLRYFNIILAVCITMRKEVKPY